MGLVSALLAAKNDVFHFPGTLSADVSPQSGYDLEYVQHTWLALFARWNDTDEPSITWTPEDEGGSPRSIDVDTVALLATNMQRQTVIEVFVDTDSETDLLVAQATIEMIATTEVPRNLILVLPEVIRNVSSVTVSIGNVTADTLDIGGLWVSRSLRPRYGQSADWGHGVTDLGRRNRTIGSQVSSNVRSRYRGSPGYFPRLSHHEVYGHQSTAGNDPIDITWSTDLSEFTDSDGFMKFNTSSSPYLESSSLSPMPDSAAWLEIDVDLRLDPGNEILPQLFAGGNWRLQEGNNVIAFRIEDLVGPNLLALSGGGGEFTAGVRFNHLKVCSRPPGEPSVQDFFLFSGITRPVIWLPRVTNQQWIYATGCYGYLRSSQYRHVSGPVYEATFQVEEAR